MRFDQNWIRLGKLVTGRIEGELGITMKLLGWGVLALSGVFGQYKTPPTYQLRVKPIYHMNALRVDRSLFNPLFRSADEASELEKDQADHLEVQLKQIFWMTHGFRKLDVASVMEAWEEFQTKMASYGCHCFVSGFTPGGHGPAQDKIDLACKEYARCAQCIKTDRVEGYFNDREEECTTEVAYYSKLNKDYGKVDEPKIVECGRGIEQKGKQSRCQLANCYCDRAFAYAVAEWWHKYDIGKQNIWQGGTTGLCQNTVSGLGPPTGCCGMYPDRRSYWEANGRDCCGTEVRDSNPFETDEFECCDDNGSIGLIGTCL